MTVASGATLAPFAHEAFLYESPAEHLEWCGRFVEQGIDAGEPVLVALPSYRLEPLQARFAAAATAGAVRFEPMETLGRNPAWIIPAWAEFVGPHARTGRPARGIGEPIWPARSGAELSECQRHESLLNLAFADSNGFTLLCPYDLAGLPPAVVEVARRNHPVVHDRTGPSASHTYCTDIPAAVAEALPPPPPHVTFTPFDLGSLPEVRAAAGAAGRAAGLPPSRISDLAIAATEAATNSVRHAGGCGSFACWTEDGRAVCEVRDTGAITDPMAGRRRPDLDQVGGRGLWLVHQLADLVQHRVVPGGQTLRIVVG